MRNAGLERYLMRMGGLGDSEAGAQVALPEDGTVSGAIAGPQTLTEWSASLQNALPPAVTTATPAKNPMVTIGLVGLAIYLLSR